LSISARRVDRFAVALNAARARSASPVFIGVITLYCEGQACSAREVVLHVREHDGPTTLDLGRPACWRPLTLHYVQTREERRVADEASARRSVVDQLYERQHPGEAIPLCALINVSLDALIARVLADEARV
jgi:hypothetical protein